MNARVIEAPGQVGAEITGLDLKCLSDEQWLVVSKALTTHGLLIIRNQHLDRASHIGLALKFGRIDEFDTRVPNASSSPFVAREPGTKVVTEISNVNQDGNVISQAEASARRLGRAEQWRSDGSFKEIPVKASILAAVAVTPGAGGNTEFADMHAAYLTCDEDQKQRLQLLTAWHSAVYVRAAAGEIPLEPTADPRMMTGAAHRLIVFAMSGKSALYIGENACIIDGMTMPDSRDLLEMLRSRACQGPHVYSHEWRDGDVVIWDSRRFLHRTAAWDPAMPRTLRHISVAGDS